MDDEQLEAFNLLTPNQQAVAMARLNGATLEAAYDAGTGISTDVFSKRASASRTLTNANVVNFMALMRRDVLSESIADRDEILRGLTDIARVKMSDILNYNNSPVADPETGKLVSMSSVSLKNLDEMPPGAEAAIKSVKMTRFGIALELHDALAARKQISEMQGFNAATKHEFDVGPEITRRLDDFYGDDD